MNVSQIAVVAGVGLVAYFLANKLLDRSRLQKAIAADPLFSIPGSQQSQQLIDQCGGWDECLSRLSARQ